MTSILKFIFAFVFVFASKASANVEPKTLFEGWFEVYVGAKKVGYMVERYEFANGKFKAVTYLKTNADGNSVTESLKAFSTPDLKPVSYSYTSKVGKDIKIIDATFNGEKMTLKTNDGKKESKQTKVIKKGTFLSTFLLYMIMNQKDGLSEDKSYTYNAVAEEDGTAYTGTAKVSTLDNVKGKKAFKILNKFKDSSFFSWVTPKGEFLLVRNPDSNLEVRFAEGQKEAVGDMGANLQDLKLLFGKIPGGAVEAQAAPAPKEEANVPGGKGIEIKGATKDQNP